MGTHESSADVGASSTTAGTILESSRRCEACGQIGDVSQGSRRGGEKSCSGVQESCCRTI